MNKNDVPTLLEARDLVFAYDANPHHAQVRGASLLIEPGKLIALIGANGSGKSTLVKLLAGVLTAQRGDILLRGQNYSTIEPRRRARDIGYVAQNSHTVFPFNVLEVVMTGRSPYTSRWHSGTREDVEIAVSCLRSIEAAHLAERPVTELSGGERGLVQLARALAQQPRVLLLDEPAAALDLKHRAALVSTLMTLRDTHGIAALVVTHDLSLIEPAFDEVMAMCCGEIIARGTPSEVLQDAILQRVYDDKNVRARQAFGRTLVWSELEPTAQQNTSR